MNTCTPLSPLSAALAQFTLIMGKLREAIGLCTYPPLTMQGGPIPPLNPQIGAVAWFRIQRAENRFRALVLRFLAGKMRPSKPILAPRRATATAHASNPDSTLPGGHGRTVFPRRFAWLIRQTSGMPAQHGLARAEQLRHLLAEPPVQEFLAACPRAARILAPACHMLGIEKQRLTPIPDGVGRISEAQSAVPTLTHAALFHEPPASKTPPTTPNLTAPRDFPLLVPG